MAVFMVGFFAVSAFAWGNGYGSGRGMNGNGNGRGMNANGCYGKSGANQGDYEAFHKDTQALRASICADRAELNALMAGTNPDPKKARALAENISKTRNELRAKAKKHNISGPMGGSGTGRGKGNRSGQYRVGCW